MPVHTFKPRSEEDLCKPILPFENESLIGGLWEKEVKLIFAFSTF